MNIEYARGCSKNKPANTHRATSVEELKWALFERLEFQLDQDIYSSLLIKIFTTYHMLAESELTVDDEYPSRYYPNINTLNNGNCWLREPQSKLFF